MSLARTSFNLTTMSMVESLRQNNLAFYLEQNRLSTGKQINSPSENPILAGEIIEQSELLERQEQILANISFADSFLAATDTAVSGVSDLLIEAQSIASEMVNSTADQDERDSMAELILGIIDQLVSIGNSTYGGVYLFGGQQTLSPPFTAEHGGVEYRGDASALSTHVDVLQDATINVTGDELFGALTGKVSGYVDLNPALTENSRLADLEGTAGRGVNTDGIIRISIDSPATTFSVDLSTADTMGDVIDQLNAGAEAAGLTVGPGQQFHASINADANGLQLETSGNMTVADVDGGVAGRDLGILGSGAGGVTGLDVNVRLTGRTRIEDLNGGSGLALGSIQIDNGPLSAVIDLSGATTVQQLLNQINTAGVEVTAQLNDDATGIDVINIMSGLEMRIGEDGGNTADLLGIRSLTGQTLLSDLNNGQGVDIREGHDDLLITAKDGSSFTVSLDGAETIQDVIDRINEASAAAGVAVVADLTSTGNGIRLVDSSGGGGELIVASAEFSSAVDGLGLNKQTDGTELVGDDVNGIKPDSVFSALMALHDALVTGGEDAERNITLAAEDIEEFTDYVNRMRGVIGARSSAMQKRLNLTEDAVVATKALLSELQDLDYTEAITRFQQAQTALQANLMTASELLQMSLLDYL